MNHMNSSIRNTSLFKLYDIENDFKKHKLKMNKINLRNAKTTVYKEYHSQVNIVNELKKKWMVSELTKNHEK